VKHTISLVIALVLALPATAQAAARPVKKPNILIILTDDQGHALETRF
jgi:hypothetical protein